MMYKELKAKIIQWLLDNENVFCRVSACREAFRAYIYDTDGQYLIGGEVVSDFINNIDDILYERS